MSAEPLPVLEARLDAAEVAALFRDVQALTDVEWVQAGIPGPRGDLLTRRGSLAEAHGWLAEGLARRVLLRYRHDGQTWSDSLFVTERGVRLVRVAL